MCQWKWRALRMLKSGSSQRDVARQFNAHAIWHVWRRYQRRQGPPPQWSSTRDNHSPRHIWNRSTHLRREFQTETLTVGTISGNRCISGRTGWRRLRISASVRGAELARPATSTSTSPAVQTTLASVEKDSLRSRATFSSSPIRWQDTTSCLQTSSRTLRHAMSSWRLLLWRCWRYDLGWNNGYRKGLWLIVIWILQETGVRVCKGPF